MRLPQGSSQSISIKPPTAEQYWSCLQRFFSFEEPGSRWQRLLALTGKQIKSPAIKPRDIGTLALPAQRQLFLDVFGLGTKSGCRQQGGSAATFNVMLALEDFDIFEPLTFASWLKNASHGGTFEPPGGLPDPAPCQDGVLTELSVRLSLTEAQSLWLRQAFHVVPDWELLRQGGPWDEGGSAGFVRDCLDVLPEAQGLSAADYLSAQRQFRQLLEKWRPLLPGNVLPYSILMVEGPTEVLLLPHFATLLKCDFPRQGTMVLSAGGSRQMARRYLNLRDVTSLSIALVIDADAGDQAALLEDSLRQCDLLKVWRQGEIEDTFAINVLVEQLNKYLHALGTTTFVVPQDFPQGQSRTAVLDRLFRRRGFGNFDKIGFAESVVENLSHPEHVPPDVVAVIKSICQLRRR